MGPRRARASWAALVALASACGGSEPSAGLPDAGVRATTVDPRTGIVHEVGAVGLDPSWLVTRSCAPSDAGLCAHGGEVHVDGGRVFLTGGGWPGYIGAARRGMSRTPLAWAREP